jgi:para-aminobenzoate synthetase component 1
MADTLIKNTEITGKMNAWGESRRPFIFIIDYEGKHPIVVPSGEAREEGILFSINGFTNCPGEDLPPGDLVFHSYPPGYVEYNKAFDIVMRHLQAGNSYLVNLTFPTRITCNMSLADIFHCSEARYKLLIRDEIVVFSPERFVAIENGTISSCPMKGTIDAAIQDAAGIILKDRKETAEHHTIVDLIRNDLSMVAEDVRVEKFRYIETLRTSNKTLLQVSSLIKGTLPPDYHRHLGDILFTLLPGGSVTGAPKKKTLEIIREAETYDRGYYTGIFGFFDGDRLDSGVMIRFIERNDGGLYYKSGGGITCFSKPEAEYRELIDKVYVPVA